MWSRPHCKAQAMTTGLGKTFCRALSSLAASDYNRSCNTWEHASAQFILSMCLPFLTLRVLFGHSSQFSDESGCSLYAGHLWLKEGSNMVRRHSDVIVITTSVRRKRSLYRDRRAPPCHGQRSRRREHRRRNTTRLPAGWVLLYNTNVFLSL